MSTGTAHIDTFVHDNLPPKERWPELSFEGIPELAYPERLNCAVELLDRMVADGHAESPLFYTDSAVITYGEFLAQANQIAAVLVEDLGLIPGNRVLLRGANTPQLAAAWFGVVKAGGICVTTMPLLREKELSFIVHKAKIEHCLCDDAWADEIKRTQEVQPELSKVMYFGNEAASLERAMSSKAEAFDNIDTAADDAVLIAFTSGTTGDPKATIHFHRDVMAICDCFPRYVLKPASTDVFTGTPPFAFTFGLGALLLFPMRFGASIALVAKPSPENLLRAIQDRKSSICFTSPTAYRALLESIDNYEIGSLKKCVSAGETLPLPTYNAWIDKTGIKIIDGIGATEMLHIFISAADDEIRPGATGKVVPGYEAKVVDAQGNEVDPGTVGLLAVRGPTGCRYLADQRQTRYAVDGWNYTGDAYVMDQDGYFWFHSRADDMIISSGYNISGIEVERALLAHPNVKECGVVGIPDEQRGNIVKAFVVPRDRIDQPEVAAKELQDFVKSEIAPYKYPRAVQFLAELPKTETGKLQRYKLRELG